MGKKLLLETTAPFQGLPKLVAYDEGLFEEEGLDVEFIERGHEAPKTTNTSITSTDLVNPFLSHASSFESGQAPNGSGPRYRSLMKGEIDATTLTEPYITVAERAGCRVMVVALLHGTEVATHGVDVETYASFSRAVKKAVGRINADKRKYMQYFIDYYKSDPDVAALAVDDMNLGRLQVVEPVAIPEEELERTRRWMVGWDMIDEGSPAESLVDSQRKNTAHELAVGAGGGPC